jgi:hypothetical protein
MKITNEEEYQQASKVLQSLLISIREQDEKLKSTNDEAYILSEEMLQYVISRKGELNENNK